MRFFSLSLSFAYLLALLSTAPLTADSVVPAKLSVSQAISIAMQANAGLKSAFRSHETSLSNLRTARFQTTYGLGSTLRLDRSPGDSSLNGLVSYDLAYKSLLGTEATVQLSPVGTGSDHGTVGLQLTQPLMRGRGFLSPKSDLVQSAISNTSVSNHELYQTRQATAVAVVSAYFNAVLAAEQVIVQEKAVGFAQAAYDGASKREEAGLIAGIEVTRAETSLAQTKDRLQIQRQAAKGAIDQLMLAIGLGVGEGPELIDPVPEPEKMPAVPGIEDAISTALKNRTELGVYDTRLSDRQRRLAIARDQLRPSLDLIGSYNSSDPGPGAISSSIFDVASFSTGLQFSFPLDMRTAREDRDTAARELQNVGDQRAYKKDQIVKEVRAAFRSLESARTSITIYSQNLSAAEERLHMAQRMTEEGLGSNREELEAREALVQVQSSLLAAKNDYYLAGVNLRYAMGEDIGAMEFK